MLCYTDGEFAKERKFIRMKMLAKCLGAVTLVLAVIFAYLVAGTRLQVSASNETIIPAAEHSELFEQTMRAVRAGEMGDRLYSAAPQGDIDDYVFITIDVSVGSFGLLPCEWITAGVSPMEGDIALIQNRLPDAQPLGRQKGQIILLAEADRAQTGHHVWIEYYALGYRTYADAKLK